VFRRVGPYAAGALLALGVLCALQAPLIYHVSGGHLGTELSRVLGCTAFAAGLGVLALCARENSRVRWLPVALYSLTIAALAVGIVVLGRDLGWLGVRAVKRNELRLTRTRQLTGVAAGVVGVALILLGTALILPALFFFAALSQAGH
jgi:hypothetical protein